MTAIPLASQNISAADSKSTPRDHDSERHPQRSQPPANMTGTAVSSSNKSRGALEISTILNSPPPPIKVAPTTDTLNSPPLSDALSRRVPDTRRLGAPAAQQQQQQQAATACSTPFSGGDAYTHAPGYQAGTPHSSADASRRSYSASPYACASSFVGGYQPAIQGQHGSLYAMPLESHHGSGQVTLNTPNGPIIAPYDTTTGSLAQHEKRKKNANASSRFRQRKKQMEMENTRRMEELEHKLKTTEEARDLYRNQRDDLRRIIEYAQVNRGQLPPLPKGLFEGSGGGSGGGGGGRRED